jgi:hypothetical protein
MLYNHLLSFTGKTNDKFQLFYRAIFSLREIFKQSLSGSRISIAILTLLPYLDKNLAADSAE